MNLKGRKCPNCGGEMKFDNRKHVYQCEYCSSVFKDESTYNKGNPRVEIDPQELDDVRKRVFNQVQENFEHVNKKHNHIAMIGFLITFVIMFIGIAISVIHFTLVY